VSLADLLTELDNIIAKLRYVKYGDYVLSSDHNDLVDAVKKIREILELLRTAAAAEEPEYSSWSRLYERSFSASFPEDIDVVQSYGIGFIGDRFIVVHIYVRSETYTYYNKYIFHDPDTGDVLTEFYAWRCPYGSYTVSFPTNKYYLVYPTFDDNGHVRVYRGTDMLQEITETDIDESCGSLSMKYITFFRIKSPTNNTVPYDIITYKAS